MNSFNSFVVLAQIKWGFGLNGEWVVSDYEISKYHQVKLSDMERTLKRNIMSDKKCSAHLSSTHTKIRQKMYSEINPP